MRVLGVASRPLDAVPDNPTPEALEKELTFVGLLGMIDPARPEVVEAVRVANGAGLKTVMVTGDHKDTAEAIAREIGILTPAGLVLTGPQIEAMNDTELAARAEKLQVCCRVSPQHKTRIVDAMKANGHVAAMTGDIKLWALYVTVIAIGAKVVAFAIQYVVFRIAITRKLRAAAAAQAAN